MKRRNYITKLMSSTVELDESTVLYHPSVREAKYYFGLLNKYLFQNKLTAGKIRITKLRGCWGWFVGWDDGFEIKMTDKYPSVRVFIMALAHEMVHQYQWEVDGIEDLKQGKTPNISHGPGFYAWKDTLSEFNIPLKIRY